VSQFNAPAIDPCSRVGFRFQSSRAPFARLPPQWQPPTHLQHPCDRLSGQHAAHTPPTDGAAVCIHRPSCTAL